MLLKKQFKNITSSIYIYILKSITHHNFNPVFHYSDVNNLNVNLWQLRFKNQKIKSVSFTPRCSKIYILCLIFKHLHLIWQELIIFRPDINPGMQPWHSLNRGWQPKWFSLHLNQFLMQSHSHLLQKVANLLRVSLLDEGGQMDIVLYVAIQQTGSDVSAVVAEVGEGDDRFITERYNS